MCCSSKRRAAAAAAATQQRKLATETFGTSGANQSKRELPVPPVNAVAQSQANHVDDGELLEKAGIPPPTYKESLKVNRAIIPSEPEPPVLQKQTSANSIATSSTSSQSSSSSVQSMIMNKYERKLAKLQLKMAKVTEKMERRQEKNALKEERRAARQTGGCC